MISILPKHPPLYKYIITILARLNILFYYIITYYNIYGYNMLCILEYIIIYMIIYIIIYIILYIVVVYCSNSIFKTNAGIHEAAWKYYYGTPNIILHHIRDNFVDQYHLKTWFGKEKKTKVGVFATRSWAIDHFWIPDIIDDQTIIQVDKQHPNII